MDQYKCYSRCQCGAVTLYMGDTDIGYSCMETNRRKFFPDSDLRRIPRLKPMYTCNHCVNNYGLDLCGCGSGAEFGKCSNNFPECSVPMPSVSEGRFRT